MIILNVLILMSGVFKIMFFFRVNDEFGRFVKLLSQCFSDITVFITFMTLMMLFISVLYGVVGAEYSNEDYPSLPLELYYFFQSFRNSIGDIAPPGYENWLDYIEYSEKIGSTERQLGGLVMVYIIWFLWLLQIIVALIILLNFLIAIISESYEQVMAQHILHKYKHRCEINRECLIFRQFFTNMGTFNTLIVYSQNLSDMGDDW